ncbi:hypothetical protein OE88DRAFT_1662629 [Heliocybe sulcata]|uniref:Uncharacterized protein n=1 Tax=Heliocybe sulcata TaxID=5364 RepID=A0A5C3MV58_9AGAM|nr:hypothetical protein OE88DRAFT_1662629 [Heliocybe sulcata]
MRRAALPAGIIAGGCSSLTGWAIYCTLLRPSNIQQLVPSLHATRACIASGASRPQSTSDADYQYFDRRLRSAYILVVSPLRIG